jgi:hypothetical protein
MNGTALLQALMAIPEPKSDEPVILLAGHTWDIPIHNRPHVRHAIQTWPFYRFPSPQARKAAAEKIVARAVRLGIVAEGIALAKR